MKKIKQLILLNGGYGSRVKSISKNLPKSLIEFDKKSFLIRQINLFIRKGIKEIIICAGYKGKFIIDELKKYKFKNVKIKVIVEPRKLGTGGAILNVFKQLNQNFFVTYGDSWLDIDYKKIESFFLTDKKKSVLTIVDKKLVPEHKANILLKNKKIIFYGKDSTINFTHVDYGLMILKKNIFINIKKKIFDLNLIFNNLIEQNQVKYLCVKKRFYEIGSIKGIKRFKKIINK